jgi:hypothetical protein
MGGRGGGLWGYSGEKLKGKKICKHVHINIFETLQKVLSIPYFIAMLY